VYDTQQAKMIAGKRYEKKGDVVRGWGHDLADAIWPTCMGSQSSFSSKIAYCVQKWVTVGTREKVQKHIYIADSDGSYAQPLVTLPTVCLAPRWNKDPHAPILFYSENTVSNVRLAMTNMFKKRQIICSFDGLNMLPAFSPNGKHIVFCLSKDGSSQLYHTFVRHGKRVYERLTDNEGQNISPCFTDNNHVMFVSDYKTLRPQIYQMNITTKEIIRITDGGYCACPDYCRANNKLLYSKMIDGAMQIFIYDFDEQVHTQLTKGSESKEEGCWSACGNFIMFAAKQGLNSRIARFNLITGKMQYITSASQNCSYPAWSPVYDSFIS
jgi:TolB protein